MRSRCCSCLFAFLCLSTGSRPLMAEPLQETSDAYRRYFSYDEEHRLRSEGIVGLDAGFHAGFDGGVYGDVFVVAKPFGTVAIGAGLTDRRDEKPKPYGIFTFGVFRFNDFEVYVPMRWESEETSFGLGITIPLGTRTGVQLEGFYRQRSMDEIPPANRWTAAAGLVYTLL